MVKIRLRRTGAKKQPHYRIVVADQRAPRDGRFIEVIGHYNPRTDPPTVEVDAERALHWLSVGAQPSEAVRRLLDKEGIISKAEAIKRGEIPAEAAVEALEAFKEEAAEAEAAEVEAEVEEVPEEKVEEEEALEEEPEAAEIDEEAEGAAEDVEPAQLEAEEEEPQVETEAEDAADQEAKDADDVNEDQSTEDTD